MYPYSIDISTAEGRAEYKRIIDRAAELGLEQVRGCSALWGCSALRGLQCAKGV